MRKLTFHLTPKHRIDLKIVKKRGGEVGEPLFPKMDELRRVRRGTKISRFFRHIFEHKSVRKILGSNLALIVLATSAISASSEPVSTVKAEQSIISVQDTPVTTVRSVAYPVDPVIINQGYRLFHPGLDLEGVTGDTVNPIMPGTVKNVQYVGSGIFSSAYGNAILISHGNNLSSLYAHLAKIDVVPGQEVTTFTKIGEIGSTGRSTGSHLHLEVRDGAYPINPNIILR